MGTRNIPAPQRLVAASLPVAIGSFAWENDDQTKNDSVVVKVKRR